MIRIILDNYIPDYLGLLHNYLQAPFQLTKSARSMQPNYFQPRLASFLVADPILKVNVSFTKTKNWKVGCGLISNRT